jgi:transcriptional regulator with XRE-family HTH domain
MSDYPQTIRRRLSKNVRYLRTLHGLTQEELAERVGNTHKHIGEIERARVNVGIDIVSKLARALAVDVVDLFRPDGKARSLHVMTAGQLDDLHRALRVVDVVKRASRRTAPRKK